LDGSREGKTAIQVTGVLKTRTKVSVEIKRIPIRTLEFFSLGNLEFQTDEQESNNEEEMKEVLDSLDDDHRARTIVTSQKAQRLI
jgi:poly-gamma-glutamate capsule biosynthesis protein CapA/YwtB (metallophosphatase superfamily)